LIFLKYFGGFAGDSVVPEEFRLEKFKGMEVCRSANFGNISTVSKLLHSKNIQKKTLIAKNVCHGLGTSFIFTV
jgi:hypothetical protein